jgi:hypothetical protein
MLQLTISLRALVFVLLLSVVTVTGSDVAHGAQSALTDLPVDGNIVFSGPGVDGARDIRTTDNDGGLRFYVGNNLTNPPQGAAIQFFGNDRGTFNGQAYIDSGAHANAAIIFRTAASGAVGERMRVTADGKVGIGTTSPGVGKLQVQTTGSDYGVTHTNGTQTMGTFVGNSSLTSDTGGWLGTVSDDPLHFFTNASQARMTITKGGFVGVGTTHPSDLFTIKGSSQNLGIPLLMVQNASPSFLFYVDDVGRVNVSTLSSLSSTTHVCRDASSFLSVCGSAAEYVPTVDNGVGGPQATDLVSIAPNVKNPYDDDHSPFMVSKSANSCDPNLLGLLLTSESGADGKKINDEYLPLAISGYFPAKVTMEGGPIRRGDPITSSSTPGTGMKATGACKIIGYALEDAARDGTIQVGTIQVFANTGESSAGEVTALKAEVQSLKEQNATLASRLAALEQRLNGGTVPLVAAR